MATDPEDSEARLAMVRAALAALSDADRADAIARQHARGRLSARERIAALVDAGSFREIGALITAEDAADGEAARRLSPADGVVIGTGSIDGRPVMLLSQDFTVFGGSIGKMGSAKTARALQIAINRGLPFIFMLDGGGHRIQDGQDARHFARGNPMFHDLARASGWIPIVALMLGPGFAGPTNYAGLADFVVMVRGGSTMGLAGPALVKAATGEELSNEELGGAGIQVDQQGLADLGVQTEAEAFAAARAFLSYLPSNARAVAAAMPRDGAERREEGLLTAVPANPRKSYDMRPVIRMIADRSSVFELKPTFAANVVTSFARLDGRAIGVLANQPMRLGGMLDSNACEKAAHFIALCDAFGLPIVTLIDVPGFSIGSSAERTRLGRRSAKLVYEWGHVSVPRISVVLRKGYGLGYYAMCGGRTFGAEACLAWPTAQICAMSIEGAVDVAYRRDYESAPDPARRRAELIEETRQRIGVMRAAEGFGVDEIIDPRDTRGRLIEILSQAAPRRSSGQPPKFRSIVPI